MEKRGKGKGKEQESEIPVFSPFTLFAFSPDD